MALGEYDDIRDPFHIVCRTDSVLQPGLKTVGHCAKVSDQSGQGWVKALVDAYTQEEQHGAFLVMHQDRIVCPFSALVVGEEVEVRRFEWEGEAGGIAAVCYRRGRAHRVNVTALRWVGAPPVGAEWIDAYRLWLSGQW